MPNLYVELRQSVLGVRVPEDTQMKGFRVKIGPNLDMEVPDAVQSADGYWGLYGTPAPLRGWIRRWWVVLVTCEDNGIDETRCRDHRGRPAC